VPRQAPSWESRSAKGLPRIANPSIDLHLKSLKIQVADIVEVKESIWDSFNCLPRTIYWPCAERRNACCLKLLLDLEAQPAHDGTILLRVDTSKNEEALQPDRLNLRELSK
jgi:hypothetical protein